MRLEICNVGRIKEAQIQLDGITVIAGENNVGKSTIGKTLFALLNEMDQWNELYLSQCYAAIENMMNEKCEFLEHFCMQHTNAKRRRTNRAKNLITTLCHDNEFVMSIEDLQVIANGYGGYDNSNEYNKVFKMISDFCKQYILLYQSTDVEGLFDEFSDLINEWKKIVIDALINEVNIDEVQLQSEKINKSFKIIFDNQFQTIGEDFTKISYYDNKFEPIIWKGTREGAILSGPLKTSRGVRFIESPKLFDKIGENLFKDLLHSTIDLMQPNATARQFPIRFSRRNLVENGEGIRGEFSPTDNAKEILEILQEAMNGKAVFHINDGIRFSDNDIAKPINAQNVSSGLKGLAFLEYAIRLGAIKEGDVIIFDEPEINLHPEWQLLYADVLVQMQQKMDLTILITSHSPFFIRAVEVYSDYYDMMDKLNVYLVEKSEIINVMNSEYGMTELYERLTIPFEKLEEVINE